MSTPLIAKDANPPSPYHQVCCFIFNQFNSVSVGSQSSNKGVKPFSMITFTASTASGHIAMDSPHPVMPSSVSILTSRVYLTLLKSFGSLYFIGMASIFLIFMLFSPTFRKLYFDKQPPLFPLCERPALQVTS